MDAVEDELAIRRLASAYTDAINRRDAVAAASVYAPDGTASKDGGPDVPPGKMLRNFERVVDRLQFLFQMLHSGVVDLQGDQATARWWLSEIQWMGEGDHLLWAGTYEDEVVRTAHGWRFARRTLTTHFTSRFPPDSAHVQISAYMPLPLIDGAGR